MIQYSTIEHATYNTAYGIFCSDAVPSIENCIIQDNDYGIYYSDTDHPTLSVTNTIQNNVLGGLYFTNCTYPSVSNQIITGQTNDRGAVYMDYTGEFEIGAGNNISGNSWGLTMNIGSYPSLSSAGNIPLAGNTNDDGIQIYGGSTSSSIVWHDVSADYIVMLNPSINAGGSLSIDDNVAVRFENGKYISIYGTLDANGTSTRNGIAFTRRQSDDAWYGIFFQSGSTGSLQYCTIEHATYYTAYGNYCNDSNPSIENCLIQDNDYGIYYLSVTSPTLSVNNTIQNNNFQGLYFTECSDPHVSNQTITGHADDNGAIFMDNTGEFEIGSGNVVTGNVDNRFHH